MKRLWLFCLVSASVYAVCVPETAADDAAVEPVQTGVESSAATAAPYLAAVRQFADQVLAHGRDTYGKPTPLFVDGLNVDTLDPVKWKWGDGKEWVLCNLASQQGLFRTLGWNAHVLDWARLDFNRHGNPRKLGALWQNEYGGQTTLSYDTAVIYGKNR